MSTLECLKWALSQGNTTKTGMGRGISINLLRAFINKNAGKLHIYSHDAYVCID